jgi:4-amino-4-deoxy-L-arabinose transferase-like glycosyltransferase
MRRSLALVAAATLARLALAAWIPLVPDEAYYWDWSRHLAPAYFDHPGAIAYLIRAGTLLFGDTPFGVRFGPVLAGTGTALAMVALAHRWGGASAAWRAALIGSVMPLASVGLLLALPDAPVLLFGTLTLWTVDRAIGASGRTALAWWIASGVAAGLALDSKFTTLVLLVGVALALVVHPDLRRQLLHAGPYVACGVALLVFLPVLHWNAAHDWISFRFQIQHGLGHAHGSAIDREGALLGGEAAVISPVLLVLLGIAVARALRLAAPRPAHPGAFVAAAVATTIAAFFVWSALRHAVEPNWPALAIPPAIALLAAMPHSTLMRRWERAGVALAAAMSAVIYVHAVHPFLPIDPKVDPVGRAYGWDELADGVARIPAQWVAESRFQDFDHSGEIWRIPATWVAANRYQDAAELAFHLPGHPTVFSLNIGSRPNQYDLWPRIGETAAPGDTVLVVLDDRYALTQPPPPLRAAASAVAGPAIDMYWRGSVVGRRRIWQVTGLAHSP